MPDQFDVSLEDSDLLGEVELTTNLIIAASETDEHLSAAEIDEILGVEPPAQRLTPPPYDWLSRSRTAPGRCSGPRARTRPAVAPACITTSDPWAVTDVDREPVGEAPALAGRRTAGERGARVGVRAGLTSSSSNSKATRTRAVGLVGHRERRVRVDLARPTRAAAWPCAWSAAPACAIASAPQA